MTEGLGVLITSAAAGGHHKNDSQRGTKRLTIRGTVSATALQHFTTIRGVHEGYR